MNGVNGAAPLPAAPDEGRLALALSQTAAAARGDGGIGTLGEKTLHRAVKCYLEPDGSCHEVRVGRYVADICRGDEIIEIQTRNFAALRPKLGELLTGWRVTLACPVVRRKIIQVVDGHTGELLRRRRSPKTGAPCAVLAELYAIKPLLLHPNLRLRVLLMDAEERRTAGRGMGDRIPTALIGDIRVETPAQYARLVPAGLPPLFTSRDFARQGGMRQALAQAALNVLAAVGAAECAGKTGRLKLYRLSEKAAAENGRTGG